jgi:hypothetical protein
MPSSLMRWRERTARQGPAQRRLDQIGTRHSGRARSACSPRGCCEALAAEHFVEREREIDAEVKRAIAQLADLAGPQRAAAQPASRAGSVGSIGSMVPVRLIHARRLSAASRQFGGGCEKRMSTSQTEIRGHEDDGSARAKLAGAVTNGNSAPKWLRMR